MVTVDNLDRVLSYLPVFQRQPSELYKVDVAVSPLDQGYNLLAKWVIHTVGPVWHGGQHHEDDLLAECYRSSLALAVQHSVRTIAFPAISTGVYAFPLDRATQIAVTEVKNFLAQKTSIEQVRFVCFGKAIYQCYLDTVSRLVN